MSKKKLIIDWQRSERPRKEKPRNNPSAPPTSARNDVSGYNSVSSLTFLVVLEYPIAKPGHTYGKEERS